MGITQKPPSPRPTLTTRAASLPAHGLLQSQLLPCDFLRTILYILNPLDIFGGLNGVC